MTSAEGAVDKRFNPELALLARAETQIPEIFKRYSAQLKPLSEPTSTIGVDNVATVGSSLWNTASVDVQSGHLDDRSLYWARLAGIQALHDTKRGHLVDTFEKSSRGLLGEELQGAKRILLTGFDPFKLPENIEQCNPSGLIALKLSGVALKGYELSTGIFPVRYRDFDDNIVEKHLTREFTANKLAMVVTCSMGRERFDLEKFVCGRRNASQPDNANLAYVDFKLPPLDPHETQSAEFLESTLDWDNDTLSQINTDHRIVVNHEIHTKEDGVRKANSLDELSSKTAVAGSGGAYLSNEISYRVLRWLKHNHPDVPSGHIHVPRVDGFDSHALETSASTVASLIQSLL